VEHNDDEREGPPGYVFALRVNYHQGPAHAIVRRQIVREHVDTAESATTDRSAAGGELHTGGHELHADDTITSRHTDEVDDAAQRTLGFERHPGQPGQSW
jgi:hypothetical protein